jgi:murein DD-endopeptidase
VAASGGAVSALDLGITNGVPARIAQGFTATHNGVDIAIPEGTEILMPFDGTVTRSWHDDFNGFAVRVTNGAVTLGFAHLKEPGPPAGETLLRGTTLALSGATGHVTGPHVHVTLWSPSERIAIDPLTLIRPVLR